MILVPETQPTESDHGLYRVGNDRSKRHSEKPVRFMASYIPAASAEEEAFCRVTRATTA